MYGMHTSIVSSRPIRFIVGLEKRQFMRHAAVVPHQSKSLDRLIHGEMKEVHDNSAGWEDMGELTAIRFSQFVYTWGYDAASLHRPIDSSLEERETTRAVTCEQPRRERGSCSGQLRRVTMSCRQRRAPSLLNRSVHTDSSVLRVSVPIDYMHYPLQQPEFPY